MVDSFLGLQESDIFHWSRQIPHTPQPQKQLTKQNANLRYQLSKAKRQASSDGEGTLAELIKE
eukprot:3581714-Prorocentrum_lima.AAC.1